MALEDRRLARAINKEISSEDVFVSPLKIRDGLFPYMLRQNYDVIIMDIGLLPEPETDSIAVIKQLPESPHLLLITDVDSPEKRAQLTADGCDAVISGNLSVEHVAAAASGVVSKRRELVPEFRNRVRLETGPRLSDFVSSSTSMKRFMDIVNKVVKSESSILITGETGVGKERLARAIHEESPRGDGPFIPINCAALPDSLLESELFGHEQGAFTGAGRLRRGAFELGHQGTVFLDEIGDMPPPVQAKLLRVLQEKSFLRLGGEKTVNVNIRIMAATNRDLKQMVDDGSFRNDLYFRLGVIALHIPPLRERREDIPVLVESYLEYLAPRIGVGPPGISSEAMDSIVQYEWPGNVRELINVLERAMLLCDNDTIQITDLPEEISHCDKLLSGIASAAGDLSEFKLPPELLALPLKEVRERSLEAIERAYVSGLLKQCGGRIDKTAGSAGIGPRALYDKMKRLGLDKNDFKQQSQFQNSA